jgi:hypothetical protein
MKNFNTKITLFFTALLFTTVNSIAQTNNGKNLLFGKEINQNQINPENGLIRCATTEYEEYLQANNPKRLTSAKFEAWLAPLVENYKKLQMVASQTGGIITIPVVVHVIHNGEPVGTAPNITDAQVESQITVFNQDFRKMINTPGYNTNTVGADIQIQFALAKQDPNGNPTNGIHRVNLCQASWSENAIDNTVKPATIWDPTLYMNMWSIKFSNTQLLGYAQFPQTNLSGLAGQGGSSNTDGVVCNYATFGSSDFNDGTFITSAPYDKGRTMTHEVGHYLGLLHTFQGGCNNTAGDYCLDTPASASATSGCPTSRNSCTTLSGNDMVENYMDYSNDTCMNIFTVDQKARIATVLANSVNRSTLATSTKDQPITLFANDAEVIVEGVCGGASSGSCGTTASGQKITIYNRGNTALTSASISYSLNGGSASVYNWTGNLATHKFATVTIPVTSTTSGTLTAVVTTANGVTDQRSSNNTSSGDYYAASTPTNYTFNSLRFNLIGDRYGSETTWNLKNSNGTTLYSGGPYSNINSNTTQTLVNNQTWNLASNDCYVFTIIDSEADGITGIYGNGSYTIKNATGSITIASGGTFTASESKSFSINLTTANDTFAALNNIYVYPNPSKDVINISLPNELNSIDNFTIYNTIGQKIYQQKVSSTADLTVSTASFSKGIYLITVEKDNEKKSIQFIKD